MFAYDGWNMIQEIVRENDDKTCRSYIWGLDLSQSLRGAGGIGGLIESIECNGVHYSSFDGNGNVGELVDVREGAVEAHYEYDPFGNRIASSGGMAVENPFRFSTKYIDMESSLVYYGFRYYNPELGRWLNRDPYNERGGVNLHSFVGNDPGNSIDPFGHWRWSTRWGRRATVVAEKSCDSYDELADFVNLDEQQVEKWLKKWKENKKVRKGDEFTVPNTFVIAIGDMNWLMYKGNEIHAKSIANALLKRGFNVETISYRLHGWSRDSVVEDTNNEDTWGYAYFGHGAHFSEESQKFYTGAFVWENKDLINSWDIGKKIQIWLGSLVSQRFLLNLL